MSNTISGVLAYAKVAEPANKYQSEEKEFSIDIIVDKATFKAFGKQFPKQKGKAVDNDDFEGIYKIKPPFPDEDEQYILKLKKPAQYKDGNLLDKVYWPKVVKKVDGKAVPLEGVLIANGSTGTVSYDVTENTYGTFAKLRNVLVENLIEYKKAGGNAGDDFGLETVPVASEFEDADDGSATPAKVPAKSVEKAKPTAKAKVKPPVDEDFDDSDLPF